MPPLQAKDLGNPGAGGDAGLNDELIRVVQQRQHPRSFFE